MSKYTAKTQAEILRTAPTKDGLIAVSTDTHRLFMSYNGKWIFKNGTEDSSNYSAPKFEGKEMFRTSDIDGYSSVMNLDSGSPIGWWKSTNIIGQGKENLNIGDTIYEWKSLISEYSWVRSGFKTESYGGGNVSLQHLSVYPTVFPAVMLGGTNRYGILWLNKAIRKASRTDISNAGATHFIAARTSDNLTALTYSPSLFWKYSAGPWQFISNSSTYATSVTTKSGTGDSSRPAIWATRYGWPDATSTINLDVKHNGSSVLDLTRTGFTSKGEFYSQPALGRHGENVGWGAKNVYFYEIIIYPTALSDSDIATVETYLINKYQS